MSAKIATASKTVKSVVKAEKPIDTKKKSKVSVNTANIDPSLLEMVQSGSDDTTEIVAVKKTAPSKEKAVKARCHGAIEKKSIGDAYKYLVENKESLNEELNRLVIVDTDKLNSWKIYGCCSRTVASDGGDYCSQHSKKEGVFDYHKVFITEEITDVITHDFQDLALNHPVFEKLNKNHGGPVKGKSKKTQEINTTHKFDIDDPIAQIVLGIVKNSKLLVKLRQYAFELVKEHNEISRQKKDKFGDSLNDTTSANISSDELTDSEEIEDDDEATTTANNDISTMLKSMNNNAVDYGSDVDTEEVNKHAKAEKVKKVEKAEKAEKAEKKRSTTPPRSTEKNKSIEYMFQNENEDDGDDFEEIELNENETLYYYPKSLVVYKPINEEMESIGKLIPILKKDSCLKWNEKYYTVLSKQVIDERNVLISELDMKIFDFHKNHIGNITKMDGRKIVDHEFF